MVLQLNPNDNVAIALEEIEDIPVGHKIALCRIKQGASIIKYGYPIGTATQPIQSGQWVHTHNVATQLKGIEEYRYHPQYASSQKRNLFFNGYLRSNGSAGVRNEVWIINTVGCCNAIAEELCKKGAAHFKLRNIDGIFQFSHPFGCSQMGKDLENTQKILAGLVRHPNAGGVLVIGLGCENNNIAAFKEILGSYDEKRVKFLHLQHAEDEIFEGISLLENLVLHAEKDQRRRLPLSKLILGLKCGGSDAFSGITANPLVGEISDRLVATGGSCILTEVPEMFGAEIILMNRATNEKIFRKIASLINNFKKYFMHHRQVVYDNPSPGNKNGGITTLEEKSLGCIQKGGKSSIVDVLEYGEQLSVPGLNLLNGPGNDIVSTTALVAAGAQIVLFTTGRGTPLGSPVPTIKIASNTPLAKRKNNWIDFNAGKLLTGISMQQLSETFWNDILNVASGEKLTKNEKNNYRQISLFKDGVTL